MSRKISIKLWNRSYYFKHLIGDPDCTVTTWCGQLQIEHPIYNTNHSARLFTKLYNEGVHIQGHMIKCTMTEIEFNSEIIEQ